MIELIDTKTNERISVSGLDFIKNVTPPEEVLDISEPVREKAPLKMGVRVHVSKMAERSSQDELEVIKAEIDGAMQDLDESEIEALKSKDSFVIAIKGIEVLTPVYDERSQILSVGIYNTGEEIINAIRNTVIPSLSGAFESGLPDPKIEQPLSFTSVDFKNLPPLPVEEKNFNNWRKSDEWKDVEKKRVVYVKEKALNMQRTDGDDQAENQTEANYKLAKENLAKKIKESLRLQHEATGPLDVEGEKLLRSRINDAIFKDLVSEENQAYLDALKAVRGETFGDRAKEVLRNALNNKAVKWYLGLSRNKRMAMNFAIGGAAGFALGAAASIGVVSYAGWRAARTLTSGAVGVKAGEWANKKWSIEELTARKDRDLEDLKNNENMSFEEKEKGYKDINESYKKDRLYLMAKRIGTTVGVGAITGFGAGALEHMTSGFGSGGVTNTLIESKPKAGTIEQVGSRGSTLQGGRMPRGTIFVDKTTIGGVPEPVAPTPISFADAAAVKPQVVEVASTSTLEKVLIDMEIARHNPVAGDSVWSLLRKTLGQTDEFKNLSEARKNIVLNAYVNDVLKDPSLYGAYEEGKIFIGQPDQVDFSKLFDEPKDVKHFHDLIKEAQNMPASKVESMTETVKEADSVSRNLTPISAPVEPALDAKEEISPVTPEPIAQDITSSKPPAELLDQAQLEMQNKLERLHEKFNTLNPFQQNSIEENFAARIDALATKIKNLRSTQSLMSSEALLDAEKDLSAETEKLETEMLEAIKEIIERSVPLTKPLVNIDKVGLAGVGSLDVVVGGKPSTAIKLADTITTELDNAKRRLGLLQVGLVQNPDTAIQPQTKLSMYSDVTSTPKVRVIMMQDVDNFFIQKRGWFKPEILGSKTPEWRLIKDIPYLKLEVFNTKDVLKAGLDSKIVEELSKNPLYKDFYQMLDGLRTSARSEGVPVMIGHKDTVEQVFEKLGEAMLQKLGSKVPPLQRAA